VGYKRNGVTILIDSHAHYDDERFDEDREEILQKCVDSGVTHIVNAGANIESSKKSIELSRKYPFIYAAVGVHPEDALTCDENTLDKLIDFTKEPKVVAIGEIGLDYHYEDAAPRETQKEWFAKQVDLAVKLKLPIIIHDREAHRDVLDIIKAEKGYETGGVFHCFSGSKEMAREVLNLGFAKCSMCVAGPKDLAGKLDKINNLRVASKFTNIAKNYFFIDKGRTVEIIKLTGSVELAPLVGLSEVIVDIVESGKTLEENGLEVLETICDLSARMVVNRVSMKMERERILSIVEGLRQQITKEYNV
jgi:TatD family hydrolase